MTARRCAAARSTRACQRASERLSSAVSIDSNGIVAYPDLTRWGMLRLDAKRVNGTPGVPPKYPRVGVRDERWQGEILRAVKSEATECQETQTSNSEPNRREVNWLL